MQQEQQQTAVSETSANWTAAMRAEVGQIAAVLDDRDTNTKNNHNSIKIIVTEELTVEKKEDQACAHQKSCDSCYSYSSVKCHWCAFDRACHARASPYGCFVGAPCTNSPSSSGSTSLKPSLAPPPLPPQSSASKKNCADYSNCKDCTLSSWKCHWCQFDNRCHAVGSIYGCATGVNCYSNQRCHRSTPQMVDTRNHTAMALYSIGVRDVLPPLLSFGSLVVTLCLLVCLTLCLQAARAMKGAYDDLVLNTAITTAEAVIDYQQQQQSLAATMNKSVRHVQFCLSNTGDADDENGANEGNTDDIPLLHPSSQQQLLQHCVEEDENSSLSQSLPLLQFSHNNNYTNNPNYNGTQMTAMGASTILSRKTVAPKSSNANSIMYLCGFCYIIVCAVIILANSLFLFYLPKIPVYNVCSNELDWTSIVDGMTSGKIESSFQILFSIYNPNRFDVNINLGSGTFTHDGTYIGRFEIPPQTIVVQQSISDLLLTVTLTPDKWEALALTVEYYKGTLTFQIAMSISISLPILGGYSYQANLDNYILHLADTETGRNLCACPQWKDVKPHVLNNSFYNISVF